MKVEVSDADRTLAADIHRLFSAKPHSEHIASEFALAHLAAVLRTNDVQSALEFGAGIGTLTYLLLSHGLAVECTEKHPICLAALDENLPPEMRERLTVHSRRPPPAKPFDLIIIDGRVKGAGYAKKGTICFAEGSRAEARAKLETALNTQGLTCRFTNYPTGREIRWRTTRFGFKIPQFRHPSGVIIHRRGCWIGRVEVRAPQ
jgi:hypothetical protein